MILAKTHGYCDTMRNCAAGATTVCLGRPSRLRLHSAAFCVVKRGLPTMKYRRSVKYRSMWFSVLETYGVNCAYCHSVPATQIDHVIPVSYIENHTLANLRPCCSWCNLLVGSKVFETFEEKYEWLREERSSKRRFVNRRTVCTTCRLPFQCPLHSPSIFLCAECYDAEYGKQKSRSRAWSEWLALLKDAGINPAIHREFRKAVSGLVNLHKDGKDQIFGTIYSSFAIDENTIAIQESRPEYIAFSSVEDDKYLFDDDFSY